MIDTHTVSFGAFRLDVANAHLWRDTEKLSLKPKTFSVLCYLVGRAGQLVTKEELFAALWPDVRVSAAVLKVCIREIREALADQAKAPQFIETVHRRGYQFIAPLATSTPPTLGLEAEAWGWSSLPLLQTYKSLASSLVGRNAELTQLHSWLGAAKTGRRQIVFVTGEAGIGKTTVVETFLERLTGHADVAISRGHCLAQFGEGEPYMPVLEALTQLCRAPDHEHIVDTLSRNAPTWLAQMPSVVTNETLEALRPCAQLHKRTDAARTG